MSPVTEVRLLVQRELVRSIRSVKGIVLGIITLAGAVMASLAVVLMEGGDRARAGSADALVEFQRKLIEKQTGDAALAAYLAGIPESLRSFLKLTVWLGPLLIALLGFDAVAGELQHKSVRFWTVRSRRASYFAGKLMGLWLLVGLVTLAISVLVDVFALARGYVGVVDMLAWGSRFFFVAFVIAGPWAAISTFVSSCFKQPVAALLTTFGAFFLSWLTSFAAVIVHGMELAQTGSVGPMRWYEYLYPNAYDNLLLSPQPMRVFTGLAILLGFVAAVLAGGSLLFARRDI